jgi:hypothetical protein
MGEVSQAPYKMEVDAGGMENLFSYWSCACLR